MEEGCVSFFKSLVFSHSPVCPGEMDWSALYPKHCQEGSDKKVEFADIGCGYGGLLGESIGGKNVLQDEVKFSHSL